MSHQDPDVAHLRTAAIGHNRPNPLDVLRDELLVQHQEWLARVRELVEDAAKIPEITAGTCPDVQDYLKSVRACIREGDTVLRPKAKEPHLAAGRLVDAFFQEQWSPLNEVADAVGVRLTEYLKAKADRERLEREAETAMDPTPAAPVEVKEPSRAALSRTRGTYGSTASLRGRWTFKDLDRDKLDLEALRPYLATADLERAVRAAIGKGVKSIKGVTIYQDEKAVVR